MRPRAAENWMNRRKKKLPKDLREVDGLSCVSKDMQESIKESLQHQLQDVEKRRHDLMPEHQKAQKKSRMIQSIQDQRKIYRKKMLQRKKRCGSYETMSSRKRSVFLCRTKSRRTRWQMQKWQENFRGCRQEKKEEAAMLRRQAMA